MISLTGIFLVSLLAVILVSRSSNVEAFFVGRQFTHQHNAHRHPLVGTKRRRMLLHKSSNTNNNNNANSDNNNDDDDNDDDEAPILTSSSPNALMSKTSRLSHAALKVASVDDSVNYWKTVHGGRLVRSRSNGKTNGETKLLSAFVKLGPFGGRNTSSDKAETTNQEDDTDLPSSFALEFLLRDGGVGGESITAPANNQNGLLYLGVSMLLKFQNKNPLLELMKTGTSNGDDDEQDDDTTDDDVSVAASDSESELSFDVPVRYVASAPGDGFAQLALVSHNKLHETCDFYTRVLGMDQKAQDQKLLCLRYDDDSCDDKPNDGVATTLVFENGDDERSETSTTTTEEDDGCFDHLAIKTTSSIEGLYQSILKDNNKGNTENPVQVYMKPTPMFGNTVLGLLDPNGYRVVVFGSE